MDFSKCKIVINEDKKLKLLHILNKFSDSIDNDLALLEELG